MNKEIENNRKELEEIHRPTFERLYKGYSKNEIEAKLKEYIDNRLSFKQDKNAVHIHYLSGLFDDQFKVFEDKLVSSDLILSKFNESLEPKASLQDFYSFVVWLGINQYVLTELYDQIKGNLKWDAIKFITKTIYNKIKGKKYSKIQASKTSTKPISFGYKVQVNEHSSIELSFEGLSSDDLDNVLDRTLPFLNELSNERSKKKKQRYIYDRIDKKWKALK